MYIVAGFCYIILYLFHTQVMGWVRSGQSMLTVGLVCPVHLNDAELLKKEHEKFQIAIEVSWGMAHLCIVRLSTHVNASTATTQQLMIEHVMMY